MRYVFKISVTLTLTCQGRSRVSLNDAVSLSYDFLLVFNCNVYPISVPIRYEALKYVTLNLTFQYHPRPNLMAQLRLPIYDFLLVFKGKSHFSPSSSYSCLKIVRPKRNSCKMGAGWGGVGMGILFLREYDDWLNWAKHHVGNGIEV